MAVGTDQDTRRHRPILEDPVFILTTVRTLNLKTMSLVREI
jgi:hypothetical protein